MFRSAWWQRLSRTAQRPLPSTRKASRPRSRQPRLELLEDRTAPAVITVTTAADDLTPNDGSVSLREAITAINAGNNLGDPDIIAQNPGTFGINDTINFNISASGTVQTINVGATGNGALPALLKPTIINGYSETGASVNTLANGDNARILIELNGAAAGPNADGLLLASGSGGSTLEGLAINRFSLNGIELQSSGDVIAGNFVGTNPAGTAAEANQNDGIHISNSSSSTIGGTTPAARNIASGNQNDGIHVVGSTASPATGNTIEGNFVGVNAAGTGSVGVKPIGGAAGTAGGNAVFGIEISGGNANTVGGVTAGARNVVGLNAAGIEVDNGGQNNVIQGNFSGVGADGVTPVGNNLEGIALRSDDNLAPPLGPGQANEPPVSGNIIGLNPNTNFSGLGNLVEFNGTGGIAVFGNPLPNNATPNQNAGNSILGNSVFENGRNFATAASAPTPLLGIDLTNAFVFPREDGATANDSKGHGAANDPNNFQNFPVLTSVTAVSGGIQITGSFTETAEPNTTVRIEFFANNADPLNLPAEGQTFLGAITKTTDASGKLSFTATLNAALTGVQVITADATNTTADPSAQAGAVNTFNTSEFSAGMTVTLPVPSAPAITSAATAFFGESRFNNFTITTAATPTAMLTEAGALPPGVTFKDNGDGTATLTGTPTATGSFAITITAANGFAPNGTQSYTLVALTAAERFVQALYLDELGRAGSVAELDFWVSTMTAPGGSQATVAAGIANSAAARDHLVRGWYQTYLGRPALNGEEVPWVIALLQGQSEEQVLSAILGSTEFFNHAQTLSSSGTPQQRFVQGLYQVLLFRTASSADVTFWANQVAGAGQQPVALAFLTGSSATEYRTDLVNSYYLTLLHRPLDSTGVSAWVTPGLFQTDVRTGIESSAEFFTNG